MFFLSQPSTLFEVRSHPTQYQTLGIKHLSIRHIRVFLQLVHRPVRGTPVRQEGRRTMMSIPKCVIIVVCPTSIL